MPALCQALCWALDVVIDSNRLNLKVQEITGLDSSVSRLSIHCVRICSPSFSLNSTFVCLDSLSDPFHLLPISPYQTILPASYPRERAFLLPSSSSKSLQTVSYWLIIGLMTIPKSITVAQKGMPQLARPGLCALSWRWQRECRRL